MYKKSKKLLVWCLVVSMVLTQMLFTNIALAVTTNAGADRYETAAKIALQFGTADTAVLAYGEDFPDALAAAPLAAAYKAPILLTDKAGLNTYTKDALTKLGVKNVIIVGGEGVVPKAVADEVAAMTGMAAPTRVFGADRAATALAIAKAVETKTGVAATEVFVVNSESYADALSVSSLAAMTPQAPIVLVGKDEVSADVLAYVGSKKAYVIGGEGVVSAAVMAKFTGAERFGGSDRYDTNYKVLSGFADFKFDNVFVATGENYPDALAGSVYAAKTNSPLVLVDQAITTATMDYLKTKATSSTKVYALGQLATVANAASALEAAIVPTTLKVESVSAANSMEITVKFNKEVNEGSAEDEANYAIEIGGEELAVDAFEATLEDDNKTVTLKLADTINAITSVKVTVDEDLLDASLKAMGEDSENVFIFYDEEDPSIVKTEVDGNILTVTFNEYVNAIELCKVDGEVIDLGADPDTFVLPEPVKELEINIADLDLEDGKYTATFANVADMQDEANVAGYLTTTFSVTDSSTAPKVVRVEQASSYTFEVEFSKALAADPAITAKNGGIDLVDTIVPDDDNLVYTVTLDNTGDVIDDLYDDGDDNFGLAVTVSTYQAEANDMYGDKYTKSITMALDTTGPVLVAGYNKIVNGTTFQLRFDEEIGDVDGFYAVPTAGDFTVVDADGVKLNVNAIDIAQDSDEDYTILTFTTLEPLEDGTYTVTLAADTVADVDGNGNEAFTTTVKKAAAEEEVLVKSATGDGDKVTVVYTDGDGNTVEMGASALVASNYKLDGAALPSGTALYFTSAAKDTVLIDLPAGSVEDDSQVVLQISDKVLGDDGQEIDTADLYQVVDGLTDNIKPVLTAAEKTNSTTITLTFSEDLDPDTLALDGAADDFEVKVNGVTITPSDIVAGDDADEVVLYVSAYNTSQTVTVTVVDEPAIVKDVEGNVLKAETSVTATK